MKTHKSRYHLQVQAMKSHKSRMSRMDSMAEFLISVKFLYDLARALAPAALNAAVRVL